jgi:hypothetical protein
MSRSSLERMAAASSMAAACAPKVLVMSARLFAEFDQTHAPVVGSLPFHKRFLLQAIDRDTNGSRREPYLGTYRIDRQRSLVKGHFEHPELRVAESGLVAASGRRKPKERTVLAPVLPSSGPCWCTPTSTFAAGTPNSVALAPWFLTRRANWWPCWTSRGWRLKKTKALCLWFWIRSWSPLWAIEERLFREYFRHAWTIAAMP